jgi:transcriptional regulator with XRE-family HTH domain
MSYARYGTTAGEFTKRLREELKMTQQELADEIGVHKQYISNVERDVHTLPLTFLMVLSNYCDKDRQKYLDDLLKDLAAKKVFEKVRRATRREATKST